MRRKKWARPELAQAEFFIDDPKTLKDGWKGRFARPEQPFWLELGCGKGVSTAQLTASNPEINLLGLDISSDVLGVAKRNAEKEFELIGRPVDNLLYSACNIEYLTEIFGLEDKVDRLLINFCNPWPKTKAHKHRLTHSRQLENYKSFMKKETILVFKTDDDGLFEDTQQYLVDSGFIIQEAIWELPLDHPEAKYISEHEKMFRADGLPIHYLRAAQDL